MARKDYGQYCGLARALELVGERWSLLVVRELLARPSRYTDLVDDLPGIPTNVLSTRLKELEAAGIVERQVAPAPQRGLVYALTDQGRGLQQAVLALALWGNGHLGEQHGEPVPPSSLAMALRATYDPSKARRLRATWELRAGGAIVWATTAAGTLTTGVGQAPSEPDVVLTLRTEAVPTYRQLMAALAEGRVEADGDAAVLARFGEVFSAEPRAVAV